MSDTAAQTSTSPPEADFPPIDAERVVVVDRAREAWLRRLMDTSRRNNLLYFRELKMGTLDLSEAAPEAMTALLAGESVSLSRLVPHAEETKASAKLREIGKRAASNLEEKGLQTLFLALGMATWPATDGGRPPESAVLLLPLALEFKGSEGRSLSLRVAGSPQINLTLLHAMETELGCSVEAEALLTGFGEEEETFDPETVFTRLLQAAWEVKEFSVAPRAILGNFSFQKMAMVKDLREHAAEMASNDVIAALAGYAPAREQIRSERVAIDPQEIDRTPPDNEFLILDADSSQQRVVIAALSGQNGVIQGPPGGGKSQTIANLIGSLAAQGKRVLFVAEKRAALEVVLRRLQDVGLGHLALDLHGADISQRALMQRIAQTLTLVRESTPVPIETIHRPFADRRARLNEHVARLHTPHPPTNVSLYELQGRLLRLPPEAQTELRWRGAELSRLEDSAALAIHDLLIEAAGFSSLLRRDDPSPWTGALLTDGSAVQQAMDLAVRLSRDRWPALQQTLQQIIGATGLRAPQHVEEAQALLQLLEQCAETLAKYESALYQEKLEALIAALAPAERGTAAIAWAMVSDGSFRKARQTLRHLRRAGTESVPTLLAEARAAHDQHKRWLALSPPNKIPFSAPHLPALRRAMDALTFDLNALAARMPDHSLRLMPFADLEKWLMALVADTVTPHRLPRLLGIEGAIERQGAKALLSEIRARKADTPHWIPLFDYAWYASSLEALRLSDPGIGGFDGQVHNGFVNEFRSLDKQRLQLASARVRRAHGERAIAAMNQFKEQADLVQREAGKRARHLPLRKLLAQAPDVLTALCPCWMASPLSVSQLLDAGRRYFDVVLYDEASQILPEDAMPALLRASHIVVAGDQHQLPPTAFFADGGSDNEFDEADIAPTEGFESLLDLMAAFLEPWPLEWHYRSKDETLIAFSNRHIYGDRLITFPGSGGISHLSHVLVEQTPGQDGQEESSGAEVRRVVELVLEHAEQRPKETLGVIAMGISHARRVEMALEEALKDRPDLALFFDPNRQERFFIKNLERVQGDERDAILLTIGYGKDRSGKLPYRFGPLLSEGGYRRLNVAITRARKRMTLVSSFSHQDMDPGRSKARGVELLRQYLEYAASGGKLLGDTGSSGVPLNVFEADVYDALTAKGLPLLPQWGASRFRIDLVAQHPTKPGRLVLAIECDGATYHSAPTARDRDRLRQQQLEALGWHFHRIWSTDWFLRREQEIARAVSAYEHAVVLADQEDSLGDTPFVGQDDAPQTEDFEAEPTAGIEPTSARERSPLPAYPRHSSIEGYTQAQLMTLVKWIQSDGLLRTDDEILSEMLPLLGFKKRGPRIIAAVQSAIERTRSANPKK